MRQTNGYQYEEQLSKDVILVNEKHLWNHVQFWDNQS